MKRILMALGGGLALACSAPVPPAPPAPPALAAPAPAQPTLPENATQWRARGDDLAKQGDNAGAEQAYGACARAEGADMETSLYCQTAVAVLKKMRSRDGG